METLRHLIGFFIKLAFAFFFFALVWWLVSLLIPSLSFSNIIAYKKEGGWLPAPKQYKGLFSRDNADPNNYNNVYIADAPYNGYNLISSGVNYSTVKYVTYTKDGLVETNGLPTNNTTKVPTGASTNSAQVFTNRSLFVRNLSIYEKGHVYTGLSFIGEAKSTLFRDGKFPIVAVDQSGRVIGVSSAIATTDWAVPGWVRFQTRIDYVLPNNVPCSLFFEEALNSNERTRQPVRVAIPVQCN